MKLLQLLPLTALFIGLSSCSIFLPEGREVSRLKGKAGDLQEHLDSRTEELAKAKERKAQLEGQIKTAKRQIAETDVKIKKVNKTKKKTSLSSAEHSSLDRELQELQDLKAKREEELRKAELDLQFTY